MERTSDRLLIVLIGGTAALAYVFHEIVKDNVTQGLASALADISPVFADLTGKAISLSLSTAFAGIIVAGLYRRIRREFEEDLRERLRPKLACSFDASDGECVQSATVRTSGAPSRVTSFRLKVATDRISSVEGCRGRLVAIRRGRETVLDGERLVLPFIPASAADAASKRIDAGVPELLEFLQISERNTVEVPTVRSNALSARSLFLQPGDYTFVIIVSSPDSASTVMPVLHWAGEAKSASVSL